MSSLPAARFPTVPLSERRVETVERGHDLVCKTETSDEELMARIQAGEDEAVTLLFRRYARVVRSVGLRILRDQAEAEDLVQEVFLFVHRRRDTFDVSKGSARWWLFQVMYHRAFNRRRYLLSRCHYNQTTLEANAITLADPALPEYEHSIEGIFGKAGFRKILRVLTPDERKTLGLYFFKGYSLMEISVKLGHSFGNARNHYYRGLEKIRKEMFANGVGDRSRG